VKNEAWVSSQDECSYCGNAACRGTFLFPVFENGEAVASCWRCAQQRSEKTPPRPTEETGLTVEAVEKELRELWPNCSFQIREENNAGFYKPSKRHFEIGVISTDYEIHGERFEGSTLADCMAQVRAATRTEGEGEK
jgi:hypothetical protein